MAYRFPRVPKTVLFCFIAGCASVGGDYGSGTDAGSRDLALTGASDDLSTEPDLASVAEEDLAIASTDLAGADLAKAVDLAMSIDLSKPDLATGPCTPQMTPCDLVCQNGCMAGEACDVNSAGNPNCSLAGSGTTGQGGCNTTGCVAGDVCLNFNQLALCEKYCRVDGDCPGGGTCSRTFSVNGKMFKTCSEPITNCQIQPTNSGCPAGTYCFPVATNGATGCRAAGTVPVGGMCDVGGNFDCAAGLTCVSVNMAKPLCQQLCRKNAAPSDCPSGKTCLSITGWTTNYGFCN